MSLINEALKKAQSDVSRGGPPNPMAGSLAGAHVRTEKKSPVVKLLGLVLILGAGVWAVSLFLGSSNEPQAVVEVASAQTAEPEGVPEAESVPVTQSVAEQAEVNPAPESVAVEPAAQSAEEASAAVTVPENPEPVAQAPVQSSTVASESEPAALAVAETPAETAPPVPPAETEAPAAKPTTSQELRDEIIYTLKNLVVTAVMGDGSKARIMSGGQIHRAGELIHLDLKIRFQGKKGKTLYFTDAAGEIYEKSL